MNMFVILHPTIYFNNVYFIWLNKKMSVVTCVLLIRSPGVSVKVIFSDCQNFCQSHIMCDRFNKNMQGLLIPFTALEERCHFF